MWKEREIEIKKDKETNQKRRAEMTQKESEIEIKL